MRRQAELTSWSGYSHPALSAGRSGGGSDGETHTNGHRSRSEEHTSELQSQSNLVCRLLLEKKNIEHCQFRSQADDRDTPAWIDRPCECRGFRTDDRRPLSACLSPDLFSRHDVFDTYQRDCGSSTACHLSSV